MPWIIGHGGAEYAKWGTEKMKGTRLISVSGQVRKPGVYEIEIGATFRHVIMDLAGGPLPGRNIKAFYPGGGSTAVLPAADLEVTTDKETLLTYGSDSGSAGVIVLDDSSSPVEATYRLIQFYAWESCGKCTPCRVGGDWAERTLRKMLDGEGTPTDLQLLRRIAVSTQGGRCLCLLGDSIGIVLNAALKHFFSEFETCVSQPAHMLPMVAGAS